MGERLSRSETIIPDKMMRFAQSATLAIQRERWNCYMVESVNAGRQKHHTPLMRVCIVSDAYTWRMHTFFSLWRDMWPLRTCGPKSAPPTTTRQELFWRKNPRGRSPSNQKIHFFIYGAADRSRHGKCCSCCRCGDTFHFY